MARLVVDDELLDAQVLRAVGSATYGGADVGECLATARRVRGTDLDSWHDEWRATAIAARTLAERTHGETARLAWLRASTYFRTAGVMLMGRPLDPRLVAAHGDHVAAFRAAAAMLASPPDLVEIPFEGASLPGYFFRGGDGARPTVILTGGYDGTAEELYLFNGAAALARGYHVLAFDGPGQGSALIQRGMVLRPDWNTVVRAVVDYAVARPEVDPDRLALIGLSLGAHLAPRAAAGEPRLAALIADCGSVDMYASFRARLPRPLASERPRVRRLVGRILDRMVDKPTAGWALRRGMLVHGVDTPLAFVEELRRYSLAGYAERISCPTFISHAEDDDIGASAPQLAAALTVRHELVRFTTAEGAGDHCEQGARTLFHARAFGWLDDQLQR